MTFKLYDVLGIPHGSSKEDVKRAYRKLAVQHHPDKGGDPEKFKELSHAYQVLSDDDKKRQYDQLGDAGFEQAGAGAGFEPMDPRHIFEQFFGGGGGQGFHFDLFHDMFGGGGRRGPMKRNDHLHPLRISLADAYHGTHKSIRIGLQRVCFECKETCNACQGQGMITDMRRMGFFTQMMQRPCDMCKGAGQIYRGREGCKECNGKGVMQIEEKIEIQIPRGVFNGHTIKVPKCGEQAKSENEIPGDLILQIAIQEDGNFRRADNDLIYRVPITFTESIVGKTIKVPHYSGEFEVDTSQFGVVRPDKGYFIDGKGMPIDHGKSYGNLQLQFQINYPAKKLNTEQKEKLRECLKVFDL